MSVNHEEIAEIMVTEFDTDTGSFQHAALGFGAFVGGMTGLVVGNAIESEAYSSTEALATPATEYDSTPELGGALVGAILGGMVAYRGVRRYAVRHLGLERYKEIKEI